jgi:hypothetical protein
MHSSLAWQDNYETQEEGGVYLGGKVRLQTLSWHELRNWEDIWKGNHALKLCHTSGICKRGVGAGGL